MGLWAIYYGKMFPESNGFISVISTMQSLPPSEVSGPLREVQDNTWLWLSFLMHRRLKQGECVWVT